MSPASASVALANSPSVRAVTLSKAPVGYWRLGETSGTTATDSSVSGFNGTINGSPTLGVAALPGDPGSGGMTFGGSPQDVVVTYRAALNPATFSIGCWIMRTTIPAGNGAAIECRPANSGPTASGFVLGVDTSGRGLLLTDAANQTQSVLNGAANVSNSQWHHLAATYDGSNGRLYVDGALAAGPSAMVYSQNLTQAFFIARNVLGGEGFWVGSVKDVIICSGVLGAADISDLYLVGKGALATSVAATVALVGVASAAVRAA